MAKKKQSIRDKRNLEKERKAEKFRKMYDAGTAEAVPVPPPKGKRKKSLVKAAGVKSGFAVGSDVYMTSFGRGNSAVLEKKISGRTVVDLPDSKGAFTAEAVSDADIAVTNSRLKYKVANANNPLHHNQGAPAVRQDNLHAKSKLERIFFGEVYSDDNIHIQLIYNILDLEKILAQYVLDAVYLLHNTVKDSDKDDLMGYLSVRNSYYVFMHANGQSEDPIEKQIAEQKAQFLKRLNSGRLGYFGTAFYEAPADKNSIADKQKDTKEIYHIFALIGSMRQSLFHGHRKTKRHQGSAWIYCLEDKLSQEYKDTLDKTYRSAIDRLNRDFGKTNRVNLYIIENALKCLYDSVEPSELAQDYYDFIVKKSYKYLGFSIKHMRETMLENTDAQKYKSKSFDPVRSKLYKLIDFLIYDLYYNRYPERIEDVVCRLRLTMSEEEKNEIYCKEANFVWKKLSDVILNIIGPAVDVNNVGKIKPNNSNKRWNVDKVCIKADTNYFCKLIYVLTLLLDGKEINDLLTTLINKFDNIASFIDVMDKLGLKCEFTPEYKMFADSKKICADLKLINSFSRMQKPNNKSIKVMFKDALEIMGMDISDSDEYIDNMQDRDETGKPKQRGDHNFRNFIINNVITSDRFKYLVKYSNAKTVRKLASNKKIVGFVLNHIPDTQIERYYSSCHGSGAYDINGKRKYLADILHDLDYKDFEGVINNDNDKNVTDQQKDDKSKKQAIITLYFTVLYLAVKNLIYVNSRYVIAFHCLERDYYLHDKSLDDNYSNCFELTDFFIDNGYINTRASQYLKQNISNSNTLAVKKYRNNIDHFAIVRDIGDYIEQIRDFTTWFQLYHYFMQRIVLKENISGFEKYNDMILEHNTYCKNMVKSLNAAFGYNLVRFKALSIDELFDRNNYLPDKTEKN